jgi:hypothetical protein
MRAPEQLDVSNSGDPQDYTSLIDRFRQATKKYVERLANILNGQISFGNGTALDNMQGRWINVITPVAPDTDFTVTHSLGRIPVGFITIRTDKAGVIYLGTVAATAQDLTLKCSTASTTIRIFVI